MTKQQRFAYLQGVAQAAADAESNYRINLRVKYGSASYGSRTEQTKLTKLGERSNKTFQRFFAFLQSISPRDWASCVPCNWMLRKLTYDDAITAGQMSMTPNPAWGYVQADAVRFAQPITEAR